MAGHHATLGIDFGTSNSAAGHAPDGRPVLIALEPGGVTMPTTVFFDAAERRLLTGAAANAALLEGREGRFMRALKRVLGTALLHEPRRILWERVTLAQLITRFLAELRERAEAQTGLTFRHAVSGRPVVFHATDDPREDQALEDLRACYLAAGFESVDFMAEPEAAALAAGAGRQPGMVSLIVDIGGGTSDFALIEARDAGPAILASHGLRLGGTDFDRTLSLDHVMPLLGRGGTLRRAMGPGLDPVPNALYADLATWERIPFVHTPQNLRLAAEMARLATQPAPMARLVALLEEELGHDVAFAVEDGKIAANARDDGARVSLAMLERGLAAPLPPHALAESLSRHADPLREAALATLARADLDAARVDEVVYVGGSSLMAVVPETMHALFPAARHLTHEVFTAVADGLALAASGRGFR